MSQLLTKFYLRHRYWSATGAIVLLLLAAMAVGAYELQNSRVRTAFSNALTLLIKAENRFEVELAWAATDATLGHVDEPVQQALNSTFKELMTIYTAICMSETLEGEEKGEHSEDHLRKIADEIGVDRARAATALHLPGGAMPADLTRLWMGHKPGQRSLEDVIGEVIQRGYEIVKAKGALSKDHLATIEAIETLSSGESQRILSSVLQTISQDTINQTSYGFYVLLVCCITGIVVAFVSVAAIYKPMENTILAAQDELVSERDRARASEQAKREFLAVMSHELRTPMNGVLGFTNMLLSTDLTPKQKEYAETIHTSGDILLGILNDILDVSRIEANAFELEAEDFSVADVISNVVTLLGPRAFAKRLDLGAFIDPSLPQKFSGDSGRLRQVLLNLVGNAIKFTVSGAIAIEARYGGLCADGTHDVFIAVSDTGIGIHKEEQGKIFERFTQVDTSASRKFEGTGLGLAICKQIVGLMGGEITVESVPDKGSTFSVRIRLASIKPPAEKISASFDLAVADSRILVVDDNALNRRIFRLQLEAFGIKAVCVPDARSAMMKLEQAETNGAGYDVAIIDQMMPETDGLTLRRMIRENSQYDRMKLIISSSAGVTLDQQARAFGFDAALPKPIIQATLLHKIHEVLDQRGEGAKEQEQAEPALVSTATDASKPRILLAEDNPANQRLIIAVLESVGYSVDVAADGIEAVHAAQSLPYDLILMDIRMPIMGGIEATQRIRSMTSLVSHCPIIAMTANAMTGNREEYLAAGMTDYISKPVDLHALVDKVKYHLSRRAEAVAEAAPTAPQPQAKAG